MGCLYGMRISINPSHFAGKRHPIPRQYTWSIGYQACISHERRRQTNLQVVAAYFRRQFVETRNYVDEIQLEAKLQGVLCNLCAQLLYPKGSEVSALEQFGREVVQDAQGISIIQTSFQALKQFNARYTPYWGGIMHVVWSDHSWNRVLNPNPIIRLLLRVCVRLSSLWTTIQLKLDWED